MEVSKSYIIKDGESNYSLGGYGPTRFTNDFK